MKNIILNDLKEHKVIAILRGLEPQEAVATAEALYAGGIRFAEVAFGGGIPDARCAEAILAVYRAMGEKMHIGAGSVTDLRRLTYAMENGASYIISPDTNCQIIEETVRNGLISMPGALTPTEICEAYRYGAHVVKVFPVTAMQKNYIKDIHAPLSHIPLVAVGGMNPDNITEYIRQGAVAVGMGSGLVDNQLVKAGDYAELTARAARCVENLNTL